MRKLTSYSKVQSLIGSIVRCRTAFNHTKKFGTAKLLNVGCGPFNKPEFINLDYSWHPGIDICWDITKKPYPLESGSLEGIYTEHCLEHIEFKDMKANLREFYRLLKPGGLLRVVMPDGEIYLDIYQRRKQGSNELMPYEEGYISPMARINGHKFIYDFETMRRLMEEVGFKSIKKCSFRSGSDERLLIDQEYRRPESLYVEAFK
jgi:predicted SAM-dependent methyltransferase